MSLYEAPLTIKMGKKRKLKVKLTKEKKKEALLLDSHGAVRDLNLRALEPMLCNWIQLIHQKKKAGIW